MEAILDINYYEYHNLVRKSELIRSIVKTISKFEDNDLYLSGGFLRNAAWNRLHFREDFLHTEDCDIIYHSKTIDRNYEKGIETFLKSISPYFNWSVKNQARMHLINKHKSYENLTRALECFPETASAVAINGNWNIIAPFGFQDILSLTLRPTPFCLDNEIEVFKRRIEFKRWLSNFGNLKAIQHTTLGFVQEEQTY